MGENNVPILITSFEVIANAIQGFMDGMEFKETVSEEYKRGFCDCGNAIVSTLKEMSKGGADS